MGKQLDVIQWRDTSSANVQKVSPDITLDNSVPFSMNMVFDDVLGEATSRKGTAIIGAQLVSAKIVRGLFQHYEDTAKLFAFLEDGKIWDVIAGTASVTGLSTTAKGRFATFLKSTVFVDGTNKQSYTTAGGWITTGGVWDLANLPSGATHILEFKDRGYAVVGDTIPFTRTPVSGALSWTGDGSGTLKPEQEDGGGLIKGFSKVPGYLMIYKERSLKRWNGESAFPEDLVNIGTSSHESIVRARGRNYFFSPHTGFMETNGGYPRLISRPIQRIIDAIDPAFYPHICGWSDNTNIFWSIGDITVDFGRGYTESYSNAVVRYNIDAQQFAPFYYPQTEFRVFAEYIVSGDPVIIGGDTNGQIIQIETGQVDYSNKAITYILQSPEFDFGYRREKKTIYDKIVVHSDNTVGAIIQRRMDYGEWKEFGTVDDIVTEVQIEDDLTAHVFEFRIVDSITGEQAKIRGLDFPKVEVHNIS